MCQSAYFFLQKVTVYMAYHGETVNLFILIPVTPWALNAVRDSNLHEDVAECSQLTVVPI